MLNDIINYNLDLYWLKFKRYKDSNKFKKAFEEVVRHLIFEEFQSPLNLWQLLLKLFNPLKILAKDLFDIFALSNISLQRRVYLWRLNLSIILISSLDDIFKSRGPHILLIVLLLLLNGLYCSFSDSCRRGLRFKRFTSKKVTSLINFELGKVVHIGYSFSLPIRLKLKSPLRCSKWDFFIFPRLWNVSEEKVV